MTKTDAAETLSFVMPEAVEVEETAAQMHGKFILQPLERGFATTLGTSIRRTLLSSMEGAAIQAVRIEGVQHEFTTIPGVVEDVPEFVLNLKQVRLLLHSNERKTIRVKKTGPGTLVAGDLEVDSAVQIINPSLVLATLSSDVEVNMELDLGKGRGFLLADEIETEDTPIGTVPIDAIFSPIVQVNYEVSNARVGQRTDYDKLTLDVWTDGTTTPRAAVAFAARLLREHLQLLLDDSEREEAGVRGVVALAPTSILDQRVEDLDLSMRSINCLRAAGIATVQELVLKSENDMLKYRNFGRKSLIELTEKLENMNLRFGMPPEEVAEVRAKGVDASAATEKSEEATS
jgi:DNA-directed RNA polymerase subunit alpha